MLRGSVKGSHHHCTTYLFLYIQTVWTLFPPCRLYSSTSNLWYIHTLSKLTIRLCTTDTRRQYRNINVKRPFWSFIYVHFDSCVQTGWDPGGLTRWSRWTPGWLSWFLCPDKLCVNPARCHPVQLTVQAGSTRRHTLLISFRIKVICTRQRAGYVHTRKKKKKSAK